MTCYSFANFYFPFSLLPTGFTLCMLDRLLNFNRISLVRRALKQLSQKRIVSKYSEWRHGTKNKNLMSCFCCKTELMNELFLSNKLERMERINTKIRAGIKATK